MTIGDHTLTAHPLPGGADPFVTVPGQAHFADRSFGKTCGQCKHFQQGGPRKKRFYCHKAKQFAMRWCDPILSSAIACKYFLEAGVAKPDA